MADLTLSPSAMNKLKNKEYANKMRKGSPKIQEVLRQRCRERMKEKRSQLFNRGRLGLSEKPEDVQDSLTEMVRREFSNLVSTLNDDLTLEVEQAIESEAEILQEEEQWVLSEFEKLANEELVLAMSSEEEFKNSIFCPMCQRDTLSETPNCINCPTCGMKLPGQVGLETLRRQITDVVNTHSDNCDKTPSFTIISENNNNSLFLVCDCCLALSPIV